MLKNNDIFTALFSISGNRVGFILHKKGLLSFFAIVDRKRDILRKRVFATFYCNLFFYASSNFHYIASEISETTIKSISTYENSLFFRRIRLDYNENL